MSKILVIAGSFLGGSGVLLGAFGAHTLKSLLTPTLLNSFETGVRYQIIHALLLIVLGFQNKIPTRKIGNCCVIGVTLFCTSIYLLSIKDIINVPSLNILGPVTPIGGLLLIFAWASLFVKAIQLKET